MNPVKRVAAILIEIERTRAERICTPPARLPRPTGSAAIMFAVGVHLDHSALCAIVARPLKL